MQVVKNNGILSYTIDGEKTDSKPSKEDGYIVNKIICNNGTDMMWDNDNWEIELTKASSKDRCMVDFTKDINKEGYRVTVTSNSSSSLDSLSKATTHNGTIKIYSSSKIESVTGCNGVIDDNKVIINNVNSNQTCNIMIEDKTLAGTIKSAYPPKAGRTDFSVLDDGIPGLYTGSDDQGTTYYFSGDGTNMNNWVSFAGKLWRIIRVNGNGSVRLLYAGDGTLATDIGKSAYNTQYDDSTYVGWKYGTSGSLANNRTNENKSTIYSVVEKWYNALNIINKSYVDTEAIYCNDRNIKNGSFCQKCTFMFAAYNRLNSNNPSLHCENLSDQFKNGFGLMTTDEILYAGGVYGRSNPKAYYYLAKDKSSSITGSNWWWTMSPESMSTFRSPTNKWVAYIFSVLGSESPGSIRWQDSDYNGVVRPVISLKSNVVVTGGDGSGNDPYTVAMS